MGDGGVDRGDVGRGPDHVTALRAVLQGGVHQHQGQHGLGDGRGTDADAGVVAAEGLDRVRLARHVDRLARDHRA